MRVRGTPDLPNVVGIPPRSRGGGCQLPKLAEYSVIDYDQNRGVVIVLPLTSVLEPLLGDGLDATQTLHAEEIDDQWQTGDRDGGILSRFGLV